MSIYLAGWRLPNSCVLTVLEAHSNASIHLSWFKCRSMTASGDQLSAPLLFLPAPSAAAISTGQVGGDVQETIRTTAYSTGRLHCRDPTNSSTHSYRGEVAVSRLLVHQLKGMCGQSPRRKCEPSCLRCPKAAPRPGMTRVRTDR